MKVLQFPMVLAKIRLIYVVEHNISNQQADQPQPHAPRLPDLSTFFSALEQVDTTNVSNSNAVPTPVSVAAPFRMLADALGILSRELDNGSDLLEQMRQQLMGEAEMPPREVKGVGQEFLDGKLGLYKTAECKG